MSQKEFVEALLGAADGDAADNESKRDARNAAELLRDGFATFNHQYDFKPGMEILASLLGGCFSKKNYLKNEESLNEKTRLCRSSDPHWLYQFRHLK